MNREISNFLNRIRLRIRLFVWAETGVVLTIALAVLFWIGLLLDWWWEPSRELRILAWMGVASGLAFMLYRYLWLPYGHRLPDESLALLVERAYPELRDRLLTVVAPVKSDNSEPFLRSIRQQTAELTDEIQPTKVVSFRSLGPRFAIALVLLLSVVIFAIGQRDAFATWMDRLALSETQWPRRVHLEVEGFKRDKEGRLVRSIPRFESAELMVYADLTGSYEAPAEVQVRYRTPDKKLQRGICSRVGEAQKGRDAKQEYRYQFAELSESIDLEFRGGDDRLTNLHIEVLPRPRILSLEIKAEYPDYLEMSPRQLAGSSVVTVPVGSSLHLIGRADQPLKQVDVSLTVAGMVAPVVKIDDSDSFAFQLSLDHLPAGGELSLLPIDRKGVAAREPYLITIVAEDDELPTSAAQLVGIGNSITPEARLPVQIHAEDDHAVNRMWLELLVDGQPTRGISIPGINANAIADAELEVDFIDLSTEETDPLMIKPGQRISLQSRAEDKYDLTSEPRVGSGRIITLDVVTGDQLLDELAREETNLRRTFERVIEKSVQVRDRLSAVSPDEENAAGDSLQSARISLARTVDDVHQVTEESLGIASGFQLIHDQLINNRVGDEELKSRLRDRIAQPLRSLAENELRLLATAINDTGQQGRVTNREVEQLRGRMSGIIDQMQIVLAEMKSLETYSEVVSMLRKLIQEQQNLTEKTRQEQRQQLRTFLDE